MTNLMVGLLAEYGVVVGKDHRRIFQAMKRSDDDGGDLELPERKLGWPDGDTTIRWFVGIENMAKP